MATLTLEVNSSKAIVNAIVLGYSLETMRIECGVLCVKVLELREGIRIR